MQVNPDLVCRKSIIADTVTRQGLGDFLEIQEATPYLFTRQALEK